MLSGYAYSFRERSETDDVNLEDPMSGNVEEAEHSGRMLYEASFEELAKSHVQYETVIWVLISVLLILAWGFGVLMLLYIPYRRYVLQKDISSRKLNVTSDEIIYKATKPSFLPFLRSTEIDVHIPLHMVIDIIIEQGCLQASFGICTFRIESIGHGRAAPVDQLQFHGVSNPELLRKVIIKEAAKRIQEAGSWKFAVNSSKPATSNFRSLSDVPSRLKSLRRSNSSPRHAPSGTRGSILADTLLKKMEEIKQSVKKIEYYATKSQSNDLQENF